MPSKPVSVQALCRTRDASVQSLAARLIDARGVLVGSPPHQESRTWSFRTTQVRAFSPPPSASGQGLVEDMLVWPLSAPSTRTGLVKPLLVGRSSSCDVVIDHASVSKLHARIVVTETDVRIDDAGGSNGVWVNRAKLKENEPAVLTNGDTVSFGLVQVTYFTVDGLFAALNRVRA